MAEQDERSKIKYYPSAYQGNRLRDDMYYMKSQYLPMSIEILGYVEEECDMLEYDGSIMFDEYPDKTGVEQIAARIYDKAKYLENFFMPVYEEDEVFEASKHCTSCRGQDNWLKNLIQVVLLGEMNYRRQRYYQKKSKK